MSPRFTEKEKTQIIEKYYSSKAVSIRAFCKEVGISPSNMYGWLKKAKTDNALTEKEPLGFAEVLTYTSNTLNQSNLNTGITMMYNGTMVNVPVGFDKNTLFELLSVVKAL